jgi:hypothetical protein
MEAVYFAFGLLAVAAVIGIVIKRFLPKPSSSLQNEHEHSAVSPAEVDSAPDEFKHITALREKVAAQELTAGSPLLSSGVGSDAHENIRQSVSRLQSLSVTTHSEEE